MWWRTGRTGRESTKRQLVSLSGRRLKHSFNRRPISFLLTGYLRRKAAAPRTHAMQIAVPQCPPSVAESSVLFGKNSDAAIGLSFSILRQTTLRQWLTGSDPVSWWP
jgi:hypothetical protein